MQYEHYPAPQTQPRTAKRVPLLLGVLIGLLTGWVLIGQIHGYLGQRDAAPRPITPRGDLTESERTTIEIFERAAPSVVYITTTTTRRARLGFNIYEIPAEGTGSGFVWDEYGHVVTNHHVVRGARRVKVTLSDHSSWDAVLVGEEPDKDLSVIRIDAPPSRLRPIAVGSSHDLRVGQSVLAIGNPFGFDQTLTTGVVSALGRSIESLTGRNIEGVIQTDAAINPGNSGGPLLDSAGRLVGVNTQIVSRSGASHGIGFAVPVDIVNQVVPQLIKHGRVVRPQLGVSILDDGSFRRSFPDIEGVMLLSVAPGSGAEEAGLRGIAETADGDIILGDIITAIDDHRVRNSNDLLTALEQYKPGDTVTVTYLRGESKRTARVRLQSPGFSG